jgi:hypothetical protein
MKLAGACKKQSMIITAVAMAAALVTGQSAAAATAPSVTYTAQGQFAKTVVSGGDLYKLAGEPFSLSVVASESIAPHAHGTGWAVYTNLKATGRVISGLIPQSPVPLGSTHTFLALERESSHDIVELIVPVTVINQSVRITAILTVPRGTITKTAIAPFASTVTLGSDATVTYSDGTNSTTLSIASGKLTATAATSSSSSASAALRLGNSSPAGLALRRDTDLAFAAGACAFWRRFEVL